MSSSAHAVAPHLSSPTSRWPKALGLAVVLFIAIAFIFKYVFHYYLNYNEAVFTDPVTGASNYWRMRGWLLLHITSGMTAAIVGPFQFSQRLRKRYLQLHRVSGRIYVIAVLCGCIGAF